MNQFDNFSLEASMIFMHGVQTILQNITQEFVQSLIIKSHDYHCHI